MNAASTWIGIDSITDFPEETELGKAKSVNRQVLFWVLQYVSE